MRALFVLAVAALAACEPPDSAAADLAITNPTQVSCTLLASYCDPPANNLATPACLGNFADLDAYFCGADGGAPPFRGPHAISVADCGAYRDLELGYTDTGTESYYDAASGQLVAVISDLPNSTARACAGGPPTFVFPHCQPPVPLCP